jgi:hypothetical protein
MKTNKICSGLLLGALLTSSVAFAQQSEVVLATTEKPTQEAAPVEEKEDGDPTFTLSGSIDTYARTALGTTGLNGYGPSTSFANLKGFGLGMANLIATYSGEKAGFTADLVFGPRGRDAVFNPSYTGQRIINQMYAFYKLSDKVTLNLGQFNTFLGYEVISPTLNFHYSCSYLFSWGPFNHTGLRADFDLGGGMVAKLAVMNPTDWVEFNHVNTYTLGGQIGKTSEKGGIWLNVLYGDQTGTLDKDDFAYAVDADGEVILDEDGNPIFATSSGSLFQIDLTTGWNLSDNFYLGFNTSMQSVAAGQAFVAVGDVRDVDADASSFFGAAIYPKVTVSDNFALGLRAEYFSLKNSHIPGYFAYDADNAASVMEFTLSGNIKAGNLTLIPEARIDMPSEDAFFTKDGEATNMMPSLTFAAVYKF